MKHTIKNKRLLKKQYKNFLRFNPLNITIPKPIPPYTNYRLERGYKGYWYLDYSKELDVVYILDSKYINSIV